MDFYQVVDQVVELLRHRGRVSYRALQRQFGLDDAYLEDLKAELIVAQRLAVDEHGQILVWTGGATSTMPFQAVSATPPDTPRRLEAGHGDSGGIRLYGALHLALVLLQHEGRLTYRTLMQLCGLDLALMEAVRDELLFKRVARDEHGQGLVRREEGSAVRASPLVTRDATDWLETPPPGLPAIVPVHEPTTAMDSTPAAAPSPWAAAADYSPLPTSLDASGTISEAVLWAHEAERRQLTVLFCDLVGSTTLSGQLDLEDLRAVVRAYQETAAVVMQRYEGQIAQYLGDGLLVYFSYPQAHEDDAQRAVHAGVELIEAIGELNTRLDASYGVQLAVRLGIHTGPVVVGDIGGGGRHEQLALGETPNIAARLQDLAAPNTVVISPVTARLVHQTFVLEDLGASALKGVAEPMAVWQVLGPRTPSRHDDEAAHHRTPFLVGRDEELGLLRRRWEQSKEGLGQVVLLSGAAGLGKSSLVAALRAQVGREGYARLTLRCSPYYTNSALYPVIAYLQQVLQFEWTDPPETKLAKLEQGLQTYRLPREEVVPLFSALLAVPLSAERYPARSVSPQQQRQQTQDALVAWLLEEATRHPVLAVWEDLHWADPTTLELLELLVDQIPTAAMLHVLTFRPEFSPPWPTRSYMTPITLNRLERPQVEALIAHLADGKALPAEVVAHIVAKTDGVPLYVEELTKMLLASDLLRAEAEHYVLTGPLSTMAIPETLQDSLMARLDQLTTAKEVAQLGAVLGREFAYDMLMAVSSQDEATVQDGLARLVAAELLYQRGRPPRARYIFKHALIQDAAYASLLRSTRQQVHQQVAQLLETRFPEIVETQPELVAQHYTAAGCAEQAVPYWQRAGEQASDRSAYLEAVSHLTTGIELLKTLPETPARTQHALTLHIALGAALQMAKGQRSARGGARLHPGMRVVSAGGRDARACPGPVWAVAVLCCTVTVTHGARARGNVAAPGATCRTTPRSRSSPTMPSGRRGSALARCRLPASTWRKASPATRQTSAVRRCSAWAKIRVLPAEPMPLGPSGCWGTRSKPWPASTRPWRWRTSCRIPIVWRLRGVGRPSSLSFAGTCRPCTSRQRPPSRSRPSRAFHSGRPWERACVGGRWPCRARARRGWPRSARGSPPGEPPGQRCSSHTFAPCWRKSLTTWATRKTASRRWPRPTPWWSSMRNAGGKRKSVASGASCSCDSRGRRRRRRKPGYSGLWTSPAARRRNRWSCGPP